MKMKKRFFGIMLSFMLAIGLLLSVRMTVHAATGYPLWVGSTQVTSENAADVLKDGTVSVTLPSAPGAPLTLTLNGANISEGHGGEHLSGILYGGDDIDLDNALNIVLVGDNRVVGTTEFDLGIQIGTDATISGDGSLTVSGSYSGIAVMGKLAITSGTVTASKTGEVTSAEGGIYCGSLQISGGNVSVSSTNHGLMCETGDLDISGGNVNVTSTGMAVVTVGGNLEISGGTVNAKSEEGKGIGSLGNISISGGSVTASGEEVALFSQSGTVTIGDGLKVKAGDSEKDAKDITDINTWAHDEKWVQIEGHKDPITYVKPIVEGGRLVLTKITTDQYTLLTSNPTGITFLRDGRTYVARGDIRIGALVFVGDAKLILGANTKVTVLAGIYHIGSSLEIYNEDVDGAEDAVVEVIGSPVLSGALSNDSEYTLDQITDKNATLSGTIRVYGGKLSAVQGDNAKLFAEDISLTIGPGLAAKGSKGGSAENYLTGGKKNQDGSVTYDKANLSGLVRFSTEAKPLEKPAQTAPAAPVVTATTPDSITVKTVRGVEFSIDGVHWQTSGVFTGLNPDTTYVIQARKPETESHGASPASKTVVNTPSAQSQTGGWRFGLRILNIFNLFNSAKQTVTTWNPWSIRTIFTPWWLRR